MTWIRVVLEVTCTHEHPNEPAPTCCKLGIGNPTKSCMLGDSLSGSPCRYASWGGSPASIVLTDETGESIMESSFYIEPIPSSDEYEALEIEWIENQKRYIKAADSTAQSKND